MSGITTHILDTSVGRPAAGVTVRLSALTGGDWHEVSHRTTGADGRAELTEPGQALSSGEYCVRFGVADYFAARTKESFYPAITIRFTVTDPAEHYHVPLLLSPYGYSTYRGS
jgi:5-hydroxyisourate hydrolase